MTYNYSFFSIVSWSGTTNKSEREGCRMIQNFFTVTGRYGQVSELCSTSEWRWHIISTYSGVPTFSWSTNKSFCDKDFHSTLIWGRQSAVWDVRNQSSPPLTKGQDLHLHSNSDRLTHTAKHVTDWTNYPNTRWFGPLWIMANLPAFYDYCTLI